MEYFRHMLSLKSLTLLLTCSVLAVAQQTSNNPSLPQSSRPRKIRLSAGVLSGMIDHAELPKYPAEALNLRTEGDVILRIVVDESGKAILATPVTGDPLLTSASIDALRGFRFRPYLLNGMPIRIESQVGFHFSIRGRGAGSSGKAEYRPVPTSPELFRTGAVTNEGALVLWPRRIFGGEPQLPPELAGKSGSVYLTITIGDDGKVQDVKVIGGTEPFIAPVVSAVKQFIYEPQLVDGKPTVAITQASYHFGSLR